MTALRVFHPCLPNYDNLGDIVANESLPPLFKRYGIDINLTDDDIWRRRREKCFLDDQVDAINSEFDMVLIGPGGFLGPKLIGSVFEHVDSWANLAIPVCFAGVGVIASATWPIWYDAADTSSHLFSALKKAFVISVRDQATWLLASQVETNNQRPILLTGCPSVNVVQVSGSEKKYDLAFNWSLSHEVCREHVLELIQLARVVAAQGLSVLCICHSKVDEDHVRGVQKQYRLGFEITRPRDAREAGLAYSMCRFGLVTRFHAGMFCLANHVPFGFIGYDMKCWHLMNMLVEEPYQYILPIDQLKQMDIKARVPTLIERLRGNHANITTNMKNLLKFFGEQEQRFVAACSRAASEAAHRRRV